MVITRSPGGSWQNVGSPDTYGGVISRNAEIIQAAKEAEDNALLEKNLLSYQNGEMSYSDLTAYLNTVKAGLPANTQKYVDMEKIITQADGVERSRKRENTRARMQAELSKKGGLTPTDILSIEKAMLNFETPGTEEYSQQQQSINDAQIKADEFEKQSIVSNLLATLSEGGLNTGEEIQVYTEMRDLYEPGSQEYNEAQAKIGELKVDKEKEDLEAGIASRRTDLLRKFMPDGISLEEELMITEDLLGMAPEGSEAYQELVENQAKVTEMLANEREKNAGAAEKELEERRKQEALSVVAPALSQNAELDSLVKQGLISPMEAERIQLQNWQEIQKVLGDGDISVGETNVFKANQEVKNLQLKLDLRNQGQLFNVVDRSGNVVEASLSQLQNDFSGKFNSAVFQNEDGTYEVADPFGQLGEGGNIFDKEEDAIRAAETAGIKGYSVVVDDGSGNMVKKDFVKDPSKGGFYSLDDFEANKDGILTLKKDAIAINGLPTSLAQYENLRNAAEGFQSTNAQGNKLAQEPGFMNQSKIEEKPLINQDSIKKFGPTIAQGPKAIATRAITEIAKPAISNTIEKVKSSAKQGKLNLGPINIPDFNITESIRGFDSTINNISKKYEKDKSFGSGLAPLGTKKSSTFLPDYGITEKLGVGKAVNKVKSFFGF